MMTDIRGFFLNICCGTNEVLMMKSLNLSASN